VLTFKISYHRSFQEAVWSSFVIVRYMHHRGWMSATKFRPLRTIQLSIPPPSAYNEAFMKHLGSFHSISKTQSFQIRTVTSPICQRLITTAKEHRDHCFVELSTFRTLVLFYEHTCSNVKLPSVHREDSSSLLEIAEVIFW
jgi:hypothetical protein